MPKTVTLRLDDETYRLFRQMAKDDNRPLSNFIETAAKRYIEDSEFVDEFEMGEIVSNPALNRSLKKGYRDAQMGRGRFVD
ncbi:MAG: ribbon-helix-helix protein, CopG family [Candidatus Hydrogenedentes bacterium]|nr:ribbon-helix-helix protein, CopG family [Candidatus Hydrogenedentota bacterium]